MKKYLFLLAFISLLACDNHEFMDTENEDQEKKEKPNPPVVIVDSTYVVIGDTIKIAF